MPAHTHLIGALCPLFRVTASTSRPAGPAATPMAAVTVTCSRIGGGPSGRGRCLGGQPMNPKPTFRTSRRRPAVYGQGACVGGSGSRTAGTSTATPVTKPQLACRTGPAALRLICSLAPTVTTPPAPSSDEAETGASGAVARRRGLGAQGPGALWPRIKRTFAAAASDFLRRCPCRARSRPVRSTWRRRGPTTSAAALRTTDDGVRGRGPPSLRHQAGAFEPIPG